MDRAFTRHMRAGDVNPTWVGWRLTARNRADAQIVTGGLSEVEHDERHHTTVLYMGGQVVELRDDDTVTVTAGDIGGSLGGAVA